MALKFRSDMDVDLIDSMGDDSSVVRAARVSTLGSDSLQDTGESAGLIRFLAKNRHGSPFEHATFTFYVSAPLFVFREFQRHRIASYNEESGRYKELKPTFYVPADDRPIRQIGKPGAYEFVAGTPEQSRKMKYFIRSASVMTYGAYKAMLKLGIAKEVARMVLPLNTYSSMYVTMNARALMNFLSLRTKDETSLFPSYPQREIEMVAEQMEAVFAEKMPLTYEAWDSSGRVAP